jgi:hypothetical protein
MKTERNAGGVAHIPTIGNPYAATTIPTSGSEKMSKYGVRGTTIGGNVIGSSSGMTNGSGRLNGGGLTIPTVANSGAWKMHHSGLEGASGVAVTIGGALKPIGLPPSSSAGDLLSMGSMSSSGTSQHAIINSLGDHRHSGKPP